MTDKPVKTVEELIASAPPPDKPKQPLDLPPPTGRRAAPKVRRRKGTGPLYGPHSGEQS